MLHIPFPILISLNKVFPLFTLKAEQQKETPPIYVEDCPEPVYVQEMFLWSDNIGLIYLKLKL